MVDKHKNLTGQPEEKKFFLKFSIEDLQKKYGINKQSVYARMRYLRITSWKESGRAYLDERQVQYMDELHQHIQKFGRMDGYSVPEPSGPGENESAITLAEPQGVPTNVPKNTLNYREQEVRSQPSTQIDDITSIVQNAQRKATGTLIAENVLATQYIHNPELLPVELREEIKKSAEVPAIDPFAYAQSLIAFAKSEGALG
ncbi:MULTISPECIES: hypothetical protein [Nostocales]|uniref:hypothetical protein n=1 Tax=Nostocales TaxID=1161 RepID=UPI0010FAB5E7